MREVHVNTNDIEWQNAMEYPVGIMEKILCDGSGNAPKSCLLKMKPGWEMDEHVHVYTELHYVLEGEYESQGRIYPAGTFRLIPKHVNHGPFKSDTGAIIFVVWVELHH